MTMTDKRLIGVIARLPRDNERGLIVTTNGKGEYQLEADGLPPGADIGSEVEFAARASLDLRDTPDARQVTRTDASWSVSRRRHMWILKDRP